jgi:hypothetical protein
MTPRLLVFPLIALLAACGGREDAAAAPRAEWLVQSQIRFLEADGKTARAAPDEPLRLWMPFVVGDIYGAPNAGELVPVALQADLSFSMDLRRAHGKLEKALLPTAFSQKWMAIEPTAARIARLSPFVMPADGIVPLGTTEWLDAETGSRLMLLFVDRPARVRGEIVYDKRSLRFDIEAAQAGFLWIHQPEGSGEFRAAPPPARLVLAVMPNS